MSISIPRPSPDEYTEWYAGYIAETSDIKDLVTHLGRQGDETRKLFTALSEEQANFRYAPGKWSVKDIVLHLADAERVFSYRMLWFARNDAQPLPGFSENEWAGAAGAEVRGMAGLAAELFAARASTVALLQGLGEDTLARRGTANENRFTVRSIAWIIAGHELHHLRIVRERYLTS
ncbi:MAG TPA: DinB family protein [Gemmatimonadales bacterium]|jgi:uncharacterized damage-inducible protein DinB|nr:DinB family protein [Gemmatimonadales bacterium]